VAAISIGGQQHGMVTLDASGEVVRDALLWNDTRSAAAADALKAAAERDAANTPQARFQASLETRIYSELAKRISDSLFGSTTSAPTCTPLSVGGPCGDIDIGGQNITWSIVGNNIVVRIVDMNNPNNYTELTMPYAAFKI